MMMVVGQNRTCAVPFDSGVWTVDRNGNVVFSAVGSPDYRIMVAHYESMEKAKMAFDMMISYYNSDDSGYVFRMPQEQDIFPLPTF